MMPGQATAFGGQLQRYRARAGLTQEALAERAGLTASTISALERGVRRLPYLHTRRRRAEALGLSAEEWAAFAARPRRASGGGAASLSPVYVPPTHLPAERTPLIGRAGEAGALREGLSATLAPVNRVTHDQILSAIRPHLSEAELAGAWAAGRALTLQDALVEAATLGSPLPGAGAPLVATPTGAAPEPLTRREQDVARLLAQGLTDRQIADALTISVRTVGVHVQHMLAKLHVRSRWQVVDWASTRSLSRAPAANPGPAVPHWSPLSSP